MPYQTFKSYVTDQGRKAHDYVVEGSFEDMMYFCPDVFRNLLTEDGVVEKDVADVSKEYRDQLFEFFRAVGPLLDENYILDYWLVITPQVCDSDLLSCTRPRSQGNFIVRRFNFEDIELVEKVIIPSGVAGGDAWLSSDRRKRLASNSALDTYVAVQLNSNRTDFNSWEALGRNSKEFRSAIFELSLVVGTDVCTYFNHPIRAFMPYGKREKFGKTEPVFVEQYFDNTSKKTKGWPLGEGYVRGVMRGVDRAKLRKFMAFNDLFGSTGEKFCDYGLSREELEQSRKEFAENPWVEIVDKDEDPS